jgi:hypothetical protein
MTLAEAREAWTRAKARADELWGTWQKAKTVEREAWDAYMGLKTAQMQGARAARKTGYMDAL